MFLYLPKASRKGFPLIGVMQTTPDEFQQVGCDELLSSLADRNASFQSSPSCALNRVMDVIFSNILFRVIHSGMVASVDQDIAGIIPFPAAVLLCRMKVINNKLSQCLRRPVLHILRSIPPISSNQL